MKFAIATLLLTGLWLTGNAHASQASHVHATHAWIRVLPGNLPAGGYVTLQNSGDRPAVLDAAASERYGRVMLHKSTTGGGMSRMVKVSSVTVPPHGRTMFAPGGYHLMLMQAKQAVTQGQTVAVTLSFADGSKLTTRFLARPANAMGDGEAAPTAH